MVSIIKLKCVSKNHMCSYHVLCIQIESFQEYMICIANYRTQLCEHKMQTTACY